MIPNLSNNLQSEAEMICFLFSSVAHLFIAKKLTTKR